MLALVGAIVIPLPDVAPGVAFAAQAPPNIDFTRSGFEIVARERGVTVYKNDTSNMIWVGAAGQLPAAATKIQQVLLDYNRQVGKIGRLSEARVLSRDDDGMYVYQRLNLPVISDRDFTVRVESGASDPRWWVAYWAVTDRGPAPRDGIVRVTRHRGVWDLIKLTDNTTWVRFEVRIALGGSLPLWMAKGGAGKELPELFANVCRLSVGPQEASSCS